jgi:uncharacterized protein
VTVVREYLAAVRRAGISVQRAVLFGSCARGENRADSDVDILVIAPEFDEPAGRARADVLWALRAKTDSRIEPIAVGERQWREDAVSVVIEMARREGLEISA